MTARTVWITTRFEGFHAWPDAPDEVGFLRDVHRHEFHVRVEVPVGHGNRAIEFILLKRDIANFITVTYPRGDLGASSCEAVAVRIAEHVIATYRASWAKVDVSEDGENGGSCTVSIGETRS